jgi:minor extracellular serine protease Vpr
MNARLRPLHLTVALGLGALLAAPALAQQPAPRAFPAHELERTVPTTLESLPFWDRGRARPAYDAALRLSPVGPEDRAELARPAPIYSSGPSTLDARARLLLRADPAVARRGERVFPIHALDDALAVEPDGDTWRADVFIQLADPGQAAVLDALGVERRTQVGGIVTARVTPEALARLDGHPAVRRVEAAGRSRITMAASRAEIRADLVHQGAGLPRAYQGEDVVVGVIDSGFDFSHPDFSDGSGSRIQYLLDYQQGGGQAEWSKAQIDANPGAVTQRDGNGGGGHGTHVAGTAAGSGRADMVLLGIAPRADLVLVKGVRHPDSDGGFSDADVVNGTQYIFNRAAQLGRPAVVNLSLGGNFGPRDGTSLYERTLSGLTGPGRIIVAAAGNEGFSPIHAGGTSTAGVTNLSVILPSSNLVVLDLWAKRGAVTQLNLCALIPNDQGGLTATACSGVVNVGNSAQTPLIVNGITLGYAEIDARTSQDPQNGDTNVFLVLHDNDNPAVDLTAFRWALFTQGTATGRVDVMAPRGAQFQTTALGAQGYNEMTGNVEQTVGSPSTALDVIAAGSYVTTNTWTAADGNRYNWLNPDPNNPGGMIQSVIGQGSYFSSRGPTRDGRSSPDISAPGELVFAALSSHLTPGQGYQVPLSLAGGRYLGMQGTSMASPHVAGVVALMLQAHPGLGPTEVRDILRQTARTDGLTGAVPNNRFGAGRVDAFAAVREAAIRGGGEPPQTLVLRNFDPNGTQRNFTIDRALPIDSGFVTGMNRYADIAKATAFQLPQGVTSARLSEVRVWLGYKRPGTNAQQYTLRIYGGTPGSGPQGAPLFSQTFSYAGVQADDNLQTASSPTVHTLSEEVSVGGSFFVSVDFGEYPASRAGDLTVVSSETTGSRVAGVWEMWDDRRWMNLSDAWFGSNGQPGTNGLQLWIEASAVTGGGTSTGDDAYPTALALGAAYPNPFAETATLPFELPAPGLARLAVYDVLGREVARLVDGPLPAGRHTARLEGGALASGVYLVRLEAGGEALTRRVLLVR